MSVNDIGIRNLLNAAMSNVNSLSEMIDIRNGFTKYHILYNDEVNSIITDITVFYNIISLPF